MSQQYPQQPFQPQPGGVTGPAANSPRPPKAKHTGLIIGLVVGGALLFGAGFAAGAGSTSADSAQPSTNSTPAAAETTPAPIVPEETTAEAPAEPTYGTPKKADFKLTLKVLSKQCFGSAGCNLTYRIIVSYTGPDLDPTATYDVLYVVTGGEDGPVTNTLKVTGDEYTFDEEEFVSTKKKATNLTVAVSDVLG